MIGAHTARALADLGHDVVVTANRRTDVPSFLDGRVTVESLDVTDRDAFLALGDRHDVSDIVHLAGSIPPGSGRLLPHGTAGLLNALDAARTLGRAPVRRRQQPRRVRRPDGDPAGPRTSRCPPRRCRT